MAAGEEKSGDFYSVLGLKNDCSAAELRNAYKKLALRWHPDRCSASGNSKFVEEANRKFQAIQEAYSVLSDSNKRFLYDVVGVYDSDDDENGMGDFLGEMAAMMNQTKPSENGPESFEELQQLFVEMFQTDMNGIHGGPMPTSQHPIANGYDSPSASFSSSSNFSFCNGTNGSNHKRGCTDMSSGKAKVGDSFNPGQGFCFGTNGAEKSSKGRGDSSSSSSSKRRNGRKQKVSSRHDVSSQDTEISAS